MSQSIVKVDPEIMSGAPCFAGTRVPIQNLIDYLEGGDSIEDFLEGFPSVSREQIIAFLEEAKDRMLAGRIEVKVPLDECVDRRFAHDLVGHEVTTVPRRGWAGIKNGDLLALAEKEFDAFITVDRKLSVQQDLTKFRIPMLLIRARTNRLEHIRPLAADVLEKLPRASAGVVTVIGT